MHKAHALLVYLFEFIICSIVSNQYYLRAGLQQMQSSTFLYSALNMDG